MKLRNKVISCVLALAVLASVAVLPVNADESQTSEKVLLNWNFTNVDGTAVKDSSGYGNNGTVKDAVVVADGKATFTGNRSSGILLPEGIFADAENVTIEIKMTPTYLSNNRTFFGIGSLDGNWVVMGMHSDGLRYAIDTGDGEKNGNSVSYDDGNSKNETHYDTSKKLVANVECVVKYEITANETKAYIDDTHVLTVDTTGAKSIGSVPGPIVLGSATKWNDDGFEGSIDDFKVTIDGTEKLHWDFEDGAKDVSGNGNDGLLNSVGNGVNYSFGERYPGIALPNGILKDLDNVTIEMTLKPNRLNGTIFGLGDQDEAWAVMILTGEGAIRYAIRNGQGVPEVNTNSANGLVEVGKEYTIKYEITKDLTKGYINGTEVLSLSTVGQDWIGNIEAPIALGFATKWPDQSFQGEIYNLKVSTNVPSEGIENTGTSIRVTDPGIRFKGTIDKDLAASASEYGMLIIPDAILDGAELTTETTDVLRIVAEKNYAEATDSYDYTGVVVKVPDSAIDTTLVARAYYIIDGETVYAPTVDAQSYKSVAEEAYNDPDVNADVKAAIAEIFGW